MDPALDVRIEAWLAQPESAPEEMRRVLAALVGELRQGEAERERLLEELVVERSARQAAGRAPTPNDALLELFFAQSLDGFYIMAMDEPLVWERAAPEEALVERAFSHQRVTHVNAALAAQYGARPEDLLGRSPAELNAGNRGYGLGVARQLLDHGRMHLVTEERKLDGTRIWIEGDYVSLYDGQGRYAGHFGIQREVTERVRAERELQHSAAHDALTGVFDRAFFLEALARRVAQGQREPERPFALLFVDLDRFERINDAHGHQHGDRLLVEAAARMAGALRAGDLLARLGGDEFGLLAEDLDGAGALRLADRLAAAIERPYDLDGQDDHLSASVGVALGPGRSSAQAMLRDADIAMYRAKAGGGRRCALFDAQMHALLETQTQLEAELRGALARRELLLHYQPLLELPTARLAGFEALLRWRHPQRGFCPPQEFVAVAEEAGLMPALGGFVLAEALRQLSAWQAESAAASRLRLHVNVSGRQLQQADFGGRLQRVLEQTGVRPACLALELTENALLGPSAAVDRALRGVRSLGVALCLDDFGTGHSSISRLLQPPFASVKIDRSFVSGGDPRGPEVERAVVSLARGLGLEAVAEGVETEEQRARLAKLGCQLGQGFLFAAALEPDQAARWIAAGGRP